MDKKELELLLENIPRYPNPRRDLEQYETPSTIVSHILWKALLYNDIVEKDIVELGCGMARFSLGSLVLGARKALCVDIDYSIVYFSQKIIYKKYPSYTARLNYIICDVRELELRRVDTVFMNPPFGVVKQNRGLDMVFLRKALMIADTVYTIHKYSRGLEKIMNEVSKMLGYRIVYKEILNFPIPMTYDTHKRKIYRFKTVFYILRKVENNG